MGETRDRLHAAVIAASGLIDPAPLRGAVAALDAPWRVVVAGRTSVGKTSLVNTLAGTSREIGLGGVTASIAEVPWGAAESEVILVDTPGVDDPDSALVSLGGELDRADVIVWVVDGLQPLTASERVVLDRGVPPGVLLVVCVSRADLVPPEELGSVLERVARLLGAWSPVALEAVDLRRVDTAWLAALPWVSGPRDERVRGRRASRVWDAVADARAALDGLPALPTEATVRQIWRDVVRRTVKVVASAVDRGELPNKRDAVRALRAFADEARADVASRLAPLPPPPLPDPERAGDDTLGEVLAGFAGAEEAHRVLRAVAARWLQDGELVIADWWAREPLPEQLQRRRDRLRSALAEVERSLRPSAPHSGSRSG